MAHLLKRIALVRGDITKLNVEAIVNAANKSLLGGGGVDGAIHDAAGEKLLEECERLDGCGVGEAKITGAYGIKQIKAIIHTVGPIWASSKEDLCNTQLGECYKNSLDLAKLRSLRTISFPCISTGIYGFPKKKAAEIALKTCKEWLSNKENLESMEKIVFCVFSENDYQIYEETIPQIFHEAKEEKN